MIISASITIYTIMFWKPSNNTMVKNKTREILVAGTDISSDEINLKFEDETLLDMNYKNNILKMNEDEIMKSLTREEKEKIEVIIKKLSSVDLINLREMFKNENKFVGIEQGFNFIKTRVSDKDYNEIKEILSEYIDFSSLELEI